MEIGHDIGAGHGVEIGHDIGAGHGADIGHGAAGVDADHDGIHHTSHGDDADSPSPFNPLVMASAITAFGAAGLISMMGFGLDSLVSTIVALGFSGAIGAALFFGVVKFMYGSQSNSIFSLDDLIGFEAEVITPLPEKGLGEIAYKVNGMRSTITARSMDGTEIRRGAEVVIREISGSVAVVQQKLTIDDILIDNISEDSRTDWGNREAKGSGDTGDSADTGYAGNTKVSEDAADTGGAADAAGTGNPGDTGGTGGTVSTGGISGGTGDLLDSTAESDNTADPGSTGRFSDGTGDLKETDNSKPRRNAGNKN